MTEILLHNNDAILCETEIDWFDDDALFDLSEPDERAEEKHQKREWDTKHCGKPITIWDVRTGRMRMVESRRCKNYDICPTCAGWKEKEEWKILISLIGCRYLVVDRDEEKQIARKYGGTNIRRIPINSNETAFIIKTDENIGRELVEDDCKELAVHAVPKRDGRRISGKLGVKAVVISNDDEVLELEDDFPILAMDEEPEILVEYREMIIETNKQSIKREEIERMVLDEVEIYETPGSEDELQFAIYMLEEKTKEICERVGVSFSFLGKKLYRGLLSNVRWDWTRNKRKI